MKHGLQAVVLADSTPLSVNGVEMDYARLVTLEVTYWRGVHAEHLRHRNFSFSVASSRAIPARRILREIWRHPYCPEQFGRAKAGMVAGETLGPVAQWLCRKLWLLARLPAIAVALLLLLLKVHKQWINRLLEPWMWVTVIVTGSIENWEAFWRLRCHPDAEPHIRRMAEMTRDLIRSSRSETVWPGGVHLPMIGGADLGEAFTDRNATVAKWMMVSAGRCAAVSYNNHGAGADLQKDLDRGHRMLGHEPLHASPFEHQAIVDVCGRGVEMLYSPMYRGNLPEIWIQHRKLVEDGKSVENVLRRVSEGGGRN